jgi:hypothetical protein
MDVGQVLQDPGIVGRGMAIGNFDVAPAFERREQHEEIGGCGCVRTCNHDEPAARFHRHENTDLGNKLL